MKQTIIKSTITLCILCIGFSSFAQSDKHSDKARKEVKKAQHNLDDAKEDLHQARLDSTADFKQFKKEAEMKIADNEKSIHALQDKKWDHPDQSHEKYNKQIADLQTKNDVLKEKISNANSTSPSAWSSFKKEFNHDMKELGKAIKDVGVNNVD